MKGSWRLLVGLGVGVALAILLIAVPPYVQRTGYYEIIDAVVYMGIPLVLISVAISACCWLTRKSSHGRQSK